MRFTIDTNLRILSSVTAPFLRDYLRVRGGGGLVGIEQAVLDAQDKYIINASYIVAHAALETGWGRSAIARDKHNIFGWSAFDKSPYASSKAFPDFATCIDFVMGRINALYLSPKGRYYHGCFLGRAGVDPCGMNRCYATDPLWGTKIARIADAIEVAYAKQAH